MKKGSGFPKLPLSIGEFTVFLSIASTNKVNYLLDMPGEIMAFRVSDHSTARGSARGEYTSCLLKWEKLNE